MPSVPANAAAEPEENAPASRGFATRAMPADARLRAWEEYNEQALFGLRASTLAAEGLLAEQRNLIVGRSHLTEIVGNTHVIERTPDAIARKPVDTVMMCLMLRGDAFVYHARGAEPIRAGDAVVYDSDTPFMYGFSGDNHQVILEVPRTVFQGRIAEEGVPVPRVLRLRDAAETRRWSGTSARLMLDALRHPDASHEDLEQRLLDLQTWLVDPRAAGADGYVLAAQEFIRGHLGDHDLSAGRIAAASGISERHLRRVFADAELTVAGFVTRQRLERALELLTDPLRPDRPIADIAAAVGYAAPEHFSRAFRAHFHLTPTAAREAARS
ncbi:AraC family transcriptional regulator [Microbacterium gorillae]|uniref:AraC family transcriptional regulator n=1 Tax=Microbacterium gorillae TaxID=1231063 RepID=UPI000BBE5FD2|nr:AraC family transcriptional regulator [Microbacterium gorillae]